MDEYDALFMDMTEDNKFKDESHAIIWFYEKALKDLRVLSLMADINNL
jgi:hypothetical protein